MFFFSPVVDLWSDYGCSLDASDLGIMLACDHGTFLLVWWLFKLFADRFRDKGSDSLLVLQQFQRKKKKKKCSS